MQAGRRQTKAGSRRVCLQRGEMFARARQVEQRGAGVFRCGKPETDLNPIGEVVEPAFALMKHADVRQRPQLRECLGGVGRRSEQFDITNRILAAAERSHALGPAHGRDRSKYVEEGLGDGDGASERDAGNRAAERWQRVRDRLCRRRRQSRTLPQRSFPEHGHDIGNRRDAA